ncbi:hypothetical protein HNR09_001540 [Nesterenkonia xinjiangensis]|uniref:Uncharacterized protein n=1 Tax=Nesterenkonia xinjiangensis TaxID=225327 RepID=A0A7Z0GMA1_9MICC|nr:hypothetical protein [Nesterenkonia xinjiangensis]
MVTTMTSGQAGTTSTAVHGFVIAYPRGIFDGGAHRGYSARFTRGC